MARKKNSDGVLTLEDLEAAYEAAKNQSGHIEQIVLPAGAQRQFIEAIYGALLDLNKGDWVFVQGTYVGEVIEVLKQNMIIEYKIHVKEDLNNRKPIYRIINGTMEDIKKVSKGSKLDSLLVLYGKK